MTDALVAYVAAELAARANPADAAPMAAYMKTEMPFYGVKKPGRTEVVRALKKQFAPADRDAYHRAVLALWSRPHREEKYVALAYARLWPRHVTTDSLPLYERLIREGAWWDFVDEIASHLVGGVLDRDRDRVEAILHQWIEDEDLWIRRAAIISQLRHKERTNTEMLFGFCTRCAHEPSFWIRKAIGWALRQHSLTDPDAVRAYLLANQDRLSRLSWREGGRRIGLT